MHSITSAKIITRTGALSVLMLCPLSCAMIQADIPLQSTRVLSRELKVDETPVRSTKEFTLHLDPTRRGWITVTAVNKDSCRRWRVSHVRKVTTTSYRRKNVPKKYWSWITAIAGTGLTATGIALMAVNARGFQGEKDSEKAQLERNRFMGGLWTFLPGLALAAMGTTWLALTRDRTKTVVGPVYPVKEERELVPCGTRPLAQRVIQFTLGGDDTNVNLDRTDGSGKSSLDLVPILAKAPISVVPGYVELRIKHKVWEVDFEARKHRILKGLFSNRAIALAPGTRRILWAMGGPAMPLVSRIAFTCATHLDIEATLQPEPKRPTQKRRPASIPRPRGAVRPHAGKTPTPPYPTPSPVGRAAPRSGKTVSRADKAAAPAGHDQPTAALPIDPAEIVHAYGYLADGTREEFQPHEAILLQCSPDHPIRLRIQAARRAGRVELQLAAVLNAPTGRIREREGLLLLLDKGLDYQIHIGRRGVLLLGRRKVGEFQVLKSNNNNAAARLTTDPAKVPESGRLHYRILP